MILHGFASMAIGPAVLVADGARAEALGAIACEPCTDKSCRVRVARLRG